MIKSYFKNKKFAVKQAVSDRVNVSNLGESRSKTARLTRFGIFEIGSGSFIKIFLAICGCAAGIAAQTALPVNAETKAITDLKPLLAAENKKPLLINFWATWCGPCRVEFPELVKIDADYRAKGLDFVIVSLDNFGAKDMRVAEFLKSYKSTMPSYLIDLPTRARINKAIRRIAPKSPPGLPLTLLFDEQGKLVYQKKGIINAKVLRAQIDKILAGKAD